MRRLSCFSIDQDRWNDLVNRFRRQSRFSFVSFCNLFMQDFHGRCGNLVNLLSNSTDRNNSFTGNWRIIKTNNLVVIWKLSILLNQMIELIDEIYDEYEIDN